MTIAHNFKSLPLWDAMIPAFVAEAIDAPVLVEWAFDHTWPGPWHAQNPKDPVSLAISQGDLFQSKHKYELTQEAYR